MSRLLRERPEGWFPNGWQAEIDDALRESYATAVRRLGEPSDTWQWGSARKVTLSHPFGRPPILSRIFNIGPFECPGDVNTVLQAGTVGDDPLAAPGAVPSLRMVLDVGNWDQSLFSLPGRPVRQPALAALRRPAAVLVGRQGSPDPVDYRSRRIRNCENVAPQANFQRRPIIGADRALSLPKGFVPARNTS